MSEIPKKEDYLVWFVTARRDLSTFSKPDLLPPIFLLLPFSFSLLAPSLHQLHVEGGATAVQSTLRTQVSWEERGRAEKNFEMKLKEQSS